LENSTDPPLLTAPPKSALAFQCATAFLCVLFIGFLYYRLTDIGFRQDLNIPAYRFRGFDFRAYYTFATDLLNGRSPYMHDTAAGPNPYPPLYSVLLLPFAMMDVELSYIVWTILSVAAFVSVLILGLKFGRTPAAPWLTLAVAATVLSQTYPVAFVWERGTPEFFILLFMVAGLYLLLRRRHSLAIVLLTVAVHIKLYPLILGAFVLLRAGWRWAMGFGVLVGTLFFVLGVKELKNFWTVIQYTVRVPERWIWEGNHSLRSFSSWAVSNELMDENAAGTFTLVAQIALVIVFCYLFYEAYKRRLAGAAFSVLEVGLLGMSFTLMDLLPTFSHDYKLSQQFFPLLVLMVTPGAAALAERSRPARNLFIILSGMVGAVYFPRILGIPKTPLLVAIFGLYTAVAEIALKSKGHTNLATPSPSAVTEETIASERPS